MKHWRQHYSQKLPYLSEDDWGLIEYLTGRIPLLLRALFQFKDEKFTEHEFLASAELRKVVSDVNKFTRDNGPESRKKHEADT